MSVGSIFLTPAEAAAYLRSIGWSESLINIFSNYGETSWKLIEVAEQESRLSYYANQVALRTGAQNVITSTTETALEVAERSTLEVATREVGTMAVTPVETQTGFGLSTLMGVDVGIVGAAVAPLLGVGLGVSLYEDNPEFWTRLSQKLLPFCYPDTTIIPTWMEVVDSIPQSGISKKIVDVIKDFFDEEGIGDVTYEVPSDNPFSGVVLPFQFDYREEIYYSNTRKNTFYTQKQGTTRISVAAVTNRGSGSSLSGISLVAAPVEFWSFNGQSTWQRASSFTYNGQTVYYMYSTTNAIEQGLNIYPGSFGANVNQYIAWDMIYGSIESGGYPEGTSRWDGNVPSTLPLLDPIVTSYDPDTGTYETEDIVPISLPYNIPDNWQPGTPVPSNDPDIYPDPTATTDPVVQIQPYILPSPYPNEIPTPYPQENPSPTGVPNPDPEINPSEEPTTEIPPTITDVTPEIPPSGMTVIPPLPDTPVPFSPTTGGLASVYHPTKAQLDSFAQWLWVNLSQASIQTVWNNPFDGIIGLHEIYCTPPDIGYRNIHSGFLDSGINSALAGRYTEIDCGTLGIPEYYGNYFDYSPYSRAHIYLPFIGIQELNVDDIVGHGVNVTYRIDVYNGSCIAMITVAKSTRVNNTPVSYSALMYQFSGNCAIDVPITGGSQAQIKAGMMMSDSTKQAAAISATSDIIGGLASLLTGNITGAIGGVGGGIAAEAWGQTNALGHMLSGKSNVSKSGSFSASHGALGIKKPFIIITRPKQIEVPDYNKLYGFPAHRMVTISQCTGFLRVREVDVVSATASSEEKAKIEMLLKSGVYVTDRLLQSPADDINQ